MGHLSLVKPVQVCACCRADLASDLLDTPLSSMGLQGKGGSSHYEMHPVCRVLSTLPVLIHYIITTCLKEYMALSFKVKTLRHRGLHYFDQNHTLRKFRGQGLSAGSWPCLRLLSLTMAIAISKNELMSHYS